MEHGVSAYRYRGCKCDVCMEANFEQTMERRQNGKTGGCLYPFCKHITSYSRGLCVWHYMKLLRLVNEKVRTWDELEVGGYITLQKV